MKFILRPNNRGLSDKELLDDLRSVAARLNKDFVTKDEYNKMGRLCSATFQKRFGSWCRANELAGLRRLKNYQAASEDCIADIKRVADSLGADCVAQKDYETHGGKYSLPLIARRAGSWAEAVKKAGLKLSPLYHKQITNEELFENLEQLWERLGKQPTRSDFIKPHSRYSNSVYQRRFGSYRKALEAFVASFENQMSAPKQNTIDTSLVPNDVTHTPVHKTSRNVSWRLRFLVMRRDSFKCKICGSNPALKHDVVLVVDHIIPWASGGETIMNNLQALCEQCNGGKGNLELNLPDKNSG